jgi:hypothetical protein
LELNDAGVIAVRDRVDSAVAIPASPGYAVVDGAAIVTGDDARLRSRLKPRFTHTRFWDALDTSPLSRPFPNTLSRADLAHAHLQQIWNDVRGRDRSVTEAVLAVPGWYSLEQLGLILGMAQACEMAVNGMIDSALASAAGTKDPRASARAQVVHLDLHLHRIAAARISRDNHLVREETVVDDGAGLIPLYDAWATFVAQAFVRQTRFDPLHSAQSEQTLYNHLPAWLDSLLDADEASVSMSSSGKRHSVTLTRAQLVSSASPYYDPIAALAVSVMPAGDPGLLLVSHRLGALPGLVERLTRDVADELVVLAPEAAAAGALAYEKHGPSSPKDEGALTFLTRLHLNEHGAPTAPEPMVERPANDARSPTHVLYDGVAHPLDPEPFLLGVSIPEGRRGLNLIGETAGVSRYHCSIYRANGRFVVEDHSKFGSFLNGRRVHERAPLSAGDKLRLGSPGVEVQLIEVAH